jgi:signal transduction histidine kinase
MVGGSPSGDREARLLALVSAIEGVLATDAGSAPPDGSTLERLERRVGQLIRDREQMRVEMRRRDDQFADLVEMVTSLAAFNYDVQVTVREGRDDSVNALAIGLNMMAEELLHTTADLVKARDDAMAANRAKSAFLANMSHELRTPLNAIIGYSELLCEEIGSDTNPSTQRDLERITRAARHLLSLIQNTLDLSKIEAEKLELHVVPVDVAELIEELTMTIEPSTAQKGNRVVRQIRLSTPTIYADPTRLRQVILNLLSNANKFTSRGTITLGVHEAAGADGQPWCHFSVADTGIGIPLDKQERIFEAFVQADDATTRVYGGTGLGLTISRRLVEMMGGHLTVQSELGVGSVFVAAIPAMVAGAA